MPSTQRGSLHKTATSTWGVRFYDETGARRRQGGFATKSEAGEWLDRKLEEIVALRRGDRPQRRTDVRTVTELVDKFLTGHEVDPATTRKLRSQLRHATAAFGDSAIAEVSPLDLAAWRATLPAASRHYIFRAFRQVLEQAVTWELIDKNPTARIKNTRAHSERPEMRPFDCWEQVEAIAEEMDPRHAAIPIVLVGTGLRPEELFALERRDIDTAAQVLTVERVYTQGVLEDCRKSSRQRRRVPLRQRVLAALETLPPRLDTPILFPAARGGYMDLEKFRHREWTPALRAAGVEHRRVYDSRHTFASWAIAGGMQLFYLARIMGCSITMLEQHYGHLLPDSEEYLRGMLDAYDARAATGY